MTTQLGALVVQPLSPLAEAVQAGTRSGRSQIYLLAVSLTCQVAIVSCLQAAVAFPGGHRNHNGADAVQQKKRKIKTYKEGERWWDPEEADKRGGSGILWKMSWVITA